jgi:hypothetical protein
LGNEVSGRAIAFTLWTAACLVLFFTAVLGATLGDCMDVEACARSKTHAMTIIMIAFPLAWLAGTLFIIRRGSR